MFSSNLTAMVRSISPELFQSECFLCCRKLEKLEDTKIDTVVDSLIKLLHFQRLPLTPAEANDYKYQYYTDEEYYQELFQKTSFCESCLGKIFVIKSAVEQFEQLQEQLVNLQKEVMDSLSSCCTKAETELGTFRKRVTTGLEYRLIQSKDYFYSTRPMTLTPNEDSYIDDDENEEFISTDFESRCSQTSSSPPYSPAQAAKSSTDSDLLKNCSASVNVNVSWPFLKIPTVKMVRLEDIGINFPPLKVVIPDCNIAGNDNSVKALQVEDFSIDVTEVTDKIKILPQIFIKKEYDSDSELGDSSLSTENTDRPKRKNKYLESSSSVHNCHWNAGQKLICKFCTESVAEFNACYLLWRHLRDVHKELFFGERNGNDPVPKNTQVANGHPQQCSFCPKSFKTIQSLRQHQFKMHTEEVVQNPEEIRRHVHFCEHCGKSFPKQVFLRSHLKTHDPSSNVPCSYCNTVLRSKSGLESHLLTHHPEEAVSLGVTGYKCNQCQDVLSSSRSLHVHIQVKQKDFNFLCEQCDFKCLHESGLRTHILTVHEKARAHVCQHCGARFPATYKLKVHLRTHTGEKPYECKYCCKKFHNRKSWKRHEPIHGKERRFECKLCDSKFPTQNNLDGHIKSHHKGGQFRIGVNPKRKSKYGE